MSLPRAQPPAVLVPAKPDTALRLARQYLAVARLSQRPPPASREAEIIDVECVPTYDLQNARLLFIFQQCRASVSRELELSYCL